MKWGTRACSAQFHIEVEPDAVNNWSAIPEYANALNNALGASGAEKLAADVAAGQKAFNQHAERLYINWMQMVAQA